MYDHIANQLSTIQHAFVGGESTVTNVGEFVHNVSDSLDRRYQVHTIYVNLAKVCTAFVDFEENALLRHSKRYYSDSSILSNWA